MTIDSTAIVFTTSHSCHRNATASYLSAGASALGARVGSPASATADGAEDFALEYKVLSDTIVCFLKSDLGWRVLVC